MLSWHQEHNEEQLGEALKQVKEAGVIPEEQVACASSVMGPSGYGNMSKPCFPKPVRCLMTIISAQYLQMVAKVHYGASVQA